jgi:TonB family protein
MLHCNIDKSKPNFAAAHLPALRRSGIFVSGGERQMNGKALVAAASIVVFPTPAFATNFRPSSPWNVDFGAAQCVAQRAFSDGAGTVTFALKPSLLGEVMLLVLASEGKAGVPRQRPLRLRLDDGPWIDTNVLIHGVTREDNMATTLRRVNFPSETFRKIAQAKSVQLVSDGLEATLALDTLPKVAATLQQCVDVLKRDWNVAQYYFAKVKDGPKPVVPIARIFKDEDYPLAAFSRNQGGETRLMLLVDEQGVVQDCTMSKESGVAALDAQACAITTKRAKFNPAVGKNGQPIKAPYTARIMWKMTD